MDKFDIMPLRGKPTVLVQPTKQYVYNSSNCCLPDSFVHLL